jgi:hypothetical protein
MTSVAGVPALAAVGVVGVFPNGNATPDEEIHPEPWPSSFSNHLCNWRMSFGPDSFMNEGLYQVVYVVGGRAAGRRGVRASRRMWPALWRVER